MMRALALLLALVPQLRIRFRPGPLAHGIRGQAYHLVDSLRGLRAARKARKKRADRDLQMTSDGVVVVCHWLRPLLRDGFIDPLGLIERRRRVDQMTYAEVRRLYTPRGHFRINSLEDDLREAGRLGLGAVLEPKTNDKRWRNVAMWKEWKAYARSVGVRDLRGYALPSNKGCVPAMNKAGIPTHVIGR